MTTGEARVKLRLRAWLAEQKAYSFMPVQTGYGSTTLDFLACIHGKFVAFECKAGGKKLTSRQQFVARQIAQARGDVYQVTLVNGELVFERCGLNADTSSTKTEPEPSAS